MKHITQNKFSKAPIIALFVFILGMAGVTAAPNHNQGSSFRLLLPPNGEHTVVVDNINYTHIDDRFKIDNLRPGNHRIKIVQLIINRRGQIVNRVVMYNGMVFIPKNAKVWASISYNGRFVIERIYRPAKNNRGNNNNRYDNRDYENHRDYNGDERNRDGRRDDYYDDDWYGYNDNDNRDNTNERESDRRYSDNDNNRSNLSFALTLNAIKKQAFESDRLKIAKNAVAYGYMLSSEVAEITKLFSFESTRLEFAKYAFPYTVDKKNYVIVQDAFQFSSSVSQLQDFIERYGRT